jgi:ATP-dependent helicase/nuclease subunit B
MSRPMRNEFGLPAMEQQVGQLAHDLMQLLSADEVFLTRSRKQAGKVQIPSRWLVRMRTYIQGLSPELWQGLQYSYYYAELLALLNQPLPCEASPRPSPRPPVAVRPLRISTTMLERLTTNPYTVYAETILRLRPLAPLDETPSARHFGEILHAALEIFVRRMPAAMVSQPELMLRECIAIALGDFVRWPVVTALWWPRFESLIPWLVQAERESRALTKRVFAEQSWSWPIAIGGVCVNLRAKLDRIEWRRDGTLAIIDYKTGVLPTAAEMTRSPTNQLALYALCLRHGQPLNGADVPWSSSPEHIDLFYWKLASHADQCERLQLSVDLHQAQQTLMQVLGDYLRDDYSFMCTPKYTDNRFDAYKHLARWDEWGGG